MHRIDTSTAQKDKFGAGKNGFTRGNPQTGTPATELDDDYFDMLQEELAGVVEATGTALDKSKHNQLLTALKSLLLSRAHPFADIKGDGTAAVAEALANLGLGDSDGFVGRLLAPPMRLTASGVYTPSPEAKYALVELQAAGGNGGNAPATGSGVVGIGDGGSAGGYAKFLVKIRDITNFNYTVGVHASTSNSATVGGSTSFCGVTCAGGKGGTLAVTFSGSSPVQSRGLMGGNVTNAGTTPLTLIESIQGGASGNALYTTPGNSVSGNGASSRFAQGPIGIGGTSGNGTNAKDGAGGSGANSAQYPGGGFTGGLGGDGLIILWELA
ncbi:carbohydrate kinase [Enterobacter cloacae complex sp. IR5422]|uniref:carbohydrate kinase n=1 Tax=Enterobacter cloacae complex sp. IR5422 TaxID=3412363 RepID=UPI003BA39457